MRRDTEDKVDPHKPALIVIFGNTRKRCRPLDREVFVLGRAPGCDLGLVSPEVASVHCVLIRFPNGWRVRDCSGRGATRVNGQSVHESPLSHGDVIQVGSFSFEAHLPDQPTGQPALANKTPSSLDSTRRGKLERSRRNLVRHALRMRARVVEVNAEEQELQRRRHDLEQQEERLRGRAREQEARIGRLLEERQQLEESLQAAEHERAAARPGKRPAPAAEVPTVLIPALEAAPAESLSARMARGGESAASEEMRKLEIRARELAHYTAHLLRRQSREETVGVGDHDESSELAELRDELHERNEEVLELRERLARHEAFLREDQGNYEADLHRYRQELQRDRELMEEQCLALARKQAEMERQQSQLVRQQAELLEQQAEMRKQQAQPLKGELGQKLEAVRKLRQSLAELHGSRREGPRRPDSTARTPESVSNNTRVDTSDSDSSHDEVPG
jgi:hypothetical protein